MSAQKIIGLLIGFAGIIVLLSEDLLASAHNSVIGQAAVILASLFYAGSAVAARKYTQHLEGPARGAAPLITATIFLWLASLFTKTPINLPTLPITWVAVLWLGILGSGIAMIIIIICSTKSVPHALPWSHIFFHLGVLSSVLFFSMKIFHGNCLLVERSSSPASPL